MIRDPLPSETKIRLEIERGGTWLLGLRAGADDDRLEIGLSLALDAGRNAEALACADVPELDDVQAARRHWPAQRFSVTCGDPFAPDVVGSIDVAETSAVTITARGATSVSLRSTCESAATEVACASGLDPRMVAPRVSAGRWFVVAQPFDIAPIELDVLVRRRCVDDGACEEGEICAGGVCVPPCAQDDECRGQQHCDLDAGRCVEPEPCDADADCLGLRQCRWDGECFLPDCDTHADCDPDQACVDRVCGAPLADCLGDDDCPGAQVCAPLGACVNAGACAAPEDCPAGADRCAAGDGRCVQCLADRSCDAGQACVSDRCRFAGGACEEDADCPGDRLCGAAGDCEPAQGCEGDRFDAPADPEGPGGPGYLDMRTYTRLVLCDGQADDYLVEVSDGAGLEVVLRHDADEGDLALSLEVLGPPIETLAASDGPLGVERVALTGADAPELVGVVVRGRAGATVAYSLSLAELPPVQCLPDPLEGLLGNDAPDRASLIEVGDWPLGICPDDEDWLGVELPAGLLLDLELAGDGVADDLTLDLEDPDGALLAEGGPGGPDGLTAQATIESPGLHRIRVAGQVADIQTTATLTLSAEPADDSELLACSHPLTVDPDNPVQFPRAPAVTRFAVGCGLGLPGLTADHLATFTLEDPSDVTLRLGGAELMALRSTCDDPDTEVICGAADDPLWEALPLAAGQWWVVVQSTDQQRPRLGMIVD